MHTLSKLPQFLMATMVLLWSAVCVAQGTIYESQGKGGTTLSNQPSPGAKPVDQTVAPGPIYERQGKDGPVFSGQPSPGAKPLQLGPPNVIDVGPAAAPSVPAAPAAGYQSLVIAVPVNGATVHSNTGEFAVRVRAKPSLRASQGDSIRVKLDGNLLPRTYNSSSFRISAMDWQGAANSDVQHTLQAAIVNGGGAAIIESAPVSFYMHRATVKKEAR